MDQMQESYDYKILGERYMLPRIESESQTKERILLNATLLFARQGYSGVSMRDIAKTIGIKPASLYNHFTSKEVLWLEVVNHAKDLYILYFQQLNETLERASTFEEVLNIFFIEPVKLANVFTCYAFSMVRSEQFRDETASQIVSEVFMKYSIEFIQDWFEKCIAKELVPKFDAKTVATFFMNSVLIGLDLKVQECLGRPIPLRPEEMLSDLRQFILRAARAGC